MTYYRSSAHPYFRRFKRFKRRYKGCSSTDEDNSDVDYKEERERGPWQAVCEDKGKPLLYSDLLMLEALSNLKYEVFKLKGSFAWIEPWMAQYWKKHRPDNVLQCIAQYYSKGCQDGASGIYWKKSCVDGEIYYTSLCKNE